MPRPFKMPEVGTRFGMLTLMREAPRGRGYRRKFVFLCDCGKEKIITFQHVTRPDEKRTVSCGCLHKQKTQEAFTVHGMTGSPEWITWQNMIFRCTRPEVWNYHRYGGRGITVCPEWLSSFKAFYKDMGPKPSKNHVIDRIDNNGNYEPSNCRWATKTESANNRRSSVLVTINGETNTLTNWCKVFNLPVGMVLRRKYRGWPQERWFIPKISGSIPSGEGPGQGS